MIISPTNSYTTSDLDYMLLAFEEANFSFQEGEFPVGAVVTHNGKVISKGRNRVKGKKSNMAHAEIEAISSVEDFLFHHRLECDLYTTLEPCMMCFGTILNFRIRRLFIGASDKRYGYSSILQNVDLKHYTNRAPVVATGLLAPRIEKTIKAYYRLFKEETRLSDYSL